MDKKSKQRTGFRHRAEVSRNTAPAIGIGFARSERFSGSTTQARPGVPHGGRL
jgi:uncharacterized protein involved in copper resistance